MEEDRKESSPPRSRGDMVLTVALVVYVVLLAVATYGEIFENDAILRWFR